MRYKLWITSDGRRAYYGAYSLDRLQFVLRQLADGDVAEIQVVQRKTH